MPKKGGPLNKYAVLIALIFGTCQTCAMEPENVCPELEPIHDEAEQAYKLCLLMPKNVELLVTQLQEAKETYPRGSAPAVLLLCDDKSQAVLWPRAVAQTMQEQEPHYFKYNQHIVSIEYHLMLVRDLAALFSHYTSQLPTKMHPESKINHFLEYFSYKKRKETFLICGLSSKKVKEIPYQLLHWFAQFKMPFQTIIRIPTINIDHMQIASALMSSLISDKQKEDYYLYDPENNSNIYGVERNQLVVKELARVPHDHLSDVIKNVPFKYNWIFGWYLNLNDLKTCIESALND